MQGTDADTVQHSTRLAENEQLGVASAHPVLAHWESRFDQAPAKHRVSFPCTSHADIVGG